MVAFTQFIAFHSSDISIEITRNFFFSSGFIALHVFYVIIKFQKFTTSQSPTQINSLNTKLKNGSTFPPSPQNTRIDEKIKCGLGCMQNTKSQVTGLNKAQENAFTDPFFSFSA